MPSRDAFLKNDRLLSIVLELKEAIYGYSCVEVIDQQSADDPDIVNMIFRDA